MSFTRKQWTITANALRFVGFGAFLTAFISLLLLGGYFAVKRPHIPQPEFGYTVRLIVNPAPPTYGTSQDQARMDQMFVCAILASIPIAVGESIFIYKLNIDRSSIGRINFFPVSKRGGFQSRS
jgi:hypothetical protein